MSNGNKNEAETENRLQRFGINKSRSSHRPKYTKYKMGLSTMMVICIKQHP